MDTNWGASPEKARGRGPVLLLSGVPGAGKTATAAALARRLGAARHIDVAAVGGERDAALLASGFAAQGLAALLEATIATRAQLGRLCSLLEGDPVRLVVLAPRLTAVARRAGPDAVARAGYLDEVMRRELGEVGLWLDTSELPAAAAAEAIATGFLTDDRGLVRLP